MLKTGFHTKATRRLCLHQCWEMWLLRRISIMQSTGKPCGHAIMRVPQGPQEHEALASPLPLVGPLHSPHLSPRALRASRLQVERCAGQLRASLDQSTSDFRRLRRTQQLLIKIIGPQFSLVPRPQRRWFWRWVVLACRRRGAHSDPEGRGIPLPYTKKCTLSDGIRLTVKK